ncbi:NEDD4-binding protein 2 isoform X2 [Anabas testudineus]|uniref:NEDD4-binding protein 2 isoform X2 n=1 Tax=Anabas testudineus TaxID=64144 RepID=UPI000E457299|nr:NEDD4-binding protein 2 isoform X2 [Anabas testudineus]
MPRRKKSGQSPARVPAAGPSNGDSPSHSTAYRLPHGHHDAMANNFPSSSDRDTIVKSMQEMFSHLDPEVIYIVLSECDFKVENAMDSLLELSVAAEVAVPVPSPVSGFERTAAALLSQHHFSEPRPEPGSSKPSQQPSSPPYSNLLTDELDLLVDRELESLSAQQHVKDERPSSQCSSSDQLSTWEDDTATGQQSVVDFTHLMTEMPEDKRKLPLDLAALGRRSAFQVYKKQDPLPCLSERVGVMPSDAIVGGARSKTQEPLGCKSSPWNLEAPIFSPRMHGNQVPTFITPVVQPHSNWPSKPRHFSPWPSQAPISQAPLKPSATIPKSWAVTAAAQRLDQQSRLRLEGKLLVLLRGAPGSGKSTLARALLEHNQGGVILSTDDYFTRMGKYQFDPTFLAEAHEWNHKRAREAFERGTNPVIIDNTNMQGWEMKPYVVQALRHGYKTLFREPDTWWKNKPRELERRTSHNVPVETIRRMLNGYERFVTVQSIMGSQMPERKQRLLLENTSLKTVSSGTPCPDLVGQPGLIEGYKKSHTQLSSSLPDVSSIGRSSKVGRLEDNTNKSTESLVFPLGGRPTEDPEFSDGDDDEIDMGDLDSELDAQLQINHSAGGQRIPDCIVESVMNEDHHSDEIPVAFSESIGQRVKRERQSRRSGFDQKGPSDLVKDTNQSESEAKEKEKRNEGTGQVDLLTVEEETGRPEMLDFVGDWPQDSLGQRQVRRRDRHREGTGEEGDGRSQENNKHINKVQSEPAVTEFLKLIDLIQTGVTNIQASSSPLSSPSSSCGEELEKGRFDESHGSRSNSEEREQNSVYSSRGELPDCVLDWKEADYSKVRKSKGNKQEDLKTENETSNETAGNDQVAGIVSQTGAEDMTSTNTINPPSTLTAEAQPGGCCLTDRSTKNYTDDCGESTTEAGDSWVSEVCQSPVCEGSVEADVSQGSQERKQRHGRRSGKQCKLALTFTQNCPASSLNAFEYPNITTQNIDCQTTSKADLEPDFNSPSNCKKPNFDLFTESQANLQPLSPCPLVDTGCFTQTEPQDFAVLWRLNHQDSPDNTVVTVSSHSSDFRVLSGDSSRFVPEMSCAVSAAVAVQPSGHKEVPYRVVHEKGTQVEEKELGAAQDRLESLRILIRHFKLVSFDTLEDLYDKCHQDLEWTTNLLLDSGERFFRDEDGAGDEDDLNKSSLSGAVDEIVETNKGAKVLDEDLQKEAPVWFEEGNQQSTCGTGNESNESSSNTDICLESITTSAGNKNQLDTTTQLEKAPQTELSRPEATKEEEHRVITESDLGGGAWAGSSEDGVIIEESRIETEDEIASMEEVNRLLQAELEEMEREEKQKEEEKTERRQMEERRTKHLDIQSLELKLPTELALQLTELFGPVGVDPGTCSVDDCAVQMDLNLAKLLHHKWKETVQERLRQASLSYHLLMESSAAYALQDTQPEAQSQMPFMDHWNVSRPHVSLRDIIKEQQALQENVKKTRQSGVDLNRRDGATQLKENQLYSRFPNIDRHFLKDIFRDHNYSLTQTELFLHSLLDEEPVKTVVAPEAPRSDHHRAASKEREKRQKHLESVVLDYQDREDPEYDDFRAEASLQRSRQLESFSKAAEAYKQGRKEVASFYAQQGHLHGRQMREANHRAAAQIFQRVNSSLLPNNILDLHGLHVDEALEHLAQVLKDKTTDCEHGLCRPQLSVITGRGNHSQGGIARIRPAVIDYLTSKHYRFSEPKPGLMLVFLK